MRGTEKQVKWAKELQKQAINKNKEALKVWEQVWGVSEKEYNKLSMEEPELVFEADKIFRDLIFEGIVNEDMDDKEIFEKGKKALEEEIVKLEKESEAKKWIDSRFDINSKRKVFFWPYK